MRKQSFKSYLESQMCDLSDLHSKSLYRFSALSEKNARLRNVVVLYLSLFVEQDLKTHLLKKYQYLSAGCNKLFGISMENISDFLSDNTLSEYRTIYDNYLNKTNNKENENRVKLMMHKKIMALKEEKGLSNYIIYTRLKLNPGNVNAFLKFADVSKLSLNTVRRILEFLNGVERTHSTG